MIKLHITIPSKTTTHFKPLRTRFPSKAVCFVCVSTQLQEPYRHTVTQILVLPKFAQLCKLLLPV